MTPASHRRLDLALLCHGVYSSRGTLPHLPRINLTAQTEIDLLSEPASVSTERVQGVWSGTFPRRKYLPLVLSPTDVQHQQGATKQAGKSTGCKHGRQRSKCKECGGSGICQYGWQRDKSKECGGSNFVSMGGSAIIARSAEDGVSVRMGDNTARARSVEGAASVSMGGSAVNARSARQGHLPAWPGAQNLQGMWREWHLSARATTQ